MEALYEKLAALVTTYATRIHCGVALAEHEVMCYLHVCRAVEAFARFQAAAWAKNARDMEKKVESELEKDVNDE